MKEYKLVWCRFPYVHNDPHVIFVKAETPQDAMLIAQDHIERKFGVPRNDFGISSPNGWDKRMGEIQETKPVPAGEVL